MDAVARAAGFGIGTLYRHFNSPPLRPGPEDRG
ncbi:TetR family transcriptional regulator [Streptomyces sp. NPDC056817]